LLLYSVFGKENQSNIFRIWYGCNVLLITLVIWNNVLIISICSNERNSDISSKLIWMRKWKFYVWRASNSRPSVSMLSAIFSWAINIKNKCICVIIIQIRKSGVRIHTTQMGVRFHPEIVSFGTNIFMTLKTLSDSFLTKIFKRSQIFYK